MTRNRTLYFAILGSCILALPRIAAQAAPFNWNNPAGGSWFGSSNWDPVGVPGGLDDAIIGLPGTYAVTETGNTTVNSITIQSPAATLWIQGSPAGSHTTLTSASNVLNHGTILLESINGAYHSNLTLTSGTLTNTGTIQTNPGQGGLRYLTAGVINSGTINAAADTQLYLPATGKTFNQNAGSLNGTGLFLMDDGLFNFHGGLTTGRVMLRSTQLQVHASATSPSTIIVTGAPTLLGNAGTNVSVWVQGNAIGSHTVCGTTPGASNAGTIRMESAEGAYHCHLGINGDFTNAASGVIQVNPGTGGARSITGHLINAGAVNVDAATQLIIPNHYTAAGGTLNGPAFLVNAILNETASPAAPTTIMTTGPGATLTSNNLANTTIWIRGSQLGGTLRMESVDGTYASNLTLTAGALTNSGLINVNPGAGGNRFLTGGVTNTGTINVASGSTLNLIATGKVVNQNAGAINATGQLLMDDGCCATRNCRCMPMQRPRRLSL